ncbi:MAG: hypothetical protein SOR61_09650 [Evtepia sp.]|uniref:hypothetical protein n=1 Tax=Evtepia sp. TaxID=2773933 RepID=UPI002A74A746|nr:hypothetical protein [Evtepia sp.]MDY3015415.1 hypothetical protein [Evtepia sp.]
MKEYTVSFFGHRSIQNFCLVEKRARALIRTLLLEQEYIEFLVGCHGQFDEMISCVIREEKRKLRDDNSSLVLVLPYPTAALHHQPENLLHHYDEVEICSQAAACHPKAAIQVRNRQMVDRSDLVVFCVEHQRGGAYQTMRYAQRKGKRIERLSSAGR